MAAPEEPGRYYIETWGCQMNSYDSQRFAGQLEHLGYQAATSSETADLILLNTCSIREKASHKLFSRLGALRETKTDRPNLVVGVAGCVAQSEQSKILSRSSVVDFVVGTRAVGSLPRLLEAVREGRRPIDVSMRDERFDEIRPVIAPGRGRRAYVTAVEGCDKACSFCIVPFTRGGEVNRPAQAILDEAIQAVSQGALEIELLGQNVNAYRHGDVDFAGLLRMVDRVPGLRRLRFTTSHPRELSDEVIAAMAEGAHVCDHLHLPVQSGSNSVLKRMHRGYDRDRYLSRAYKLRQRIPTLSLSTDIIVGFPGETELEFQDTMRLLDEVEFEQVFAFIYSPRPHTRAAAYDDPISAEEKKQRLQRLFERQDGRGLLQNQSFIGRNVEVLVEGPSKRDPAYFTGRTTDNRVVNFSSSSGELDGLVEVHVTAALHHSLLGERIDREAA